MSLVKLTEDLSNFKWTNYENVGSEQTPQSFNDGKGNIVTGQRSFNRPSQKALEDMESEFGPISTEPGTYKGDERISEGTRGSYGIADFMDGTKQGRGFIPPGGEPLGFTSDMTVSNIEINDELTLTPLSYTIAGVDSTLDYGVVPEQTINTTPILENAWGSDFVVLPIENYVSKYAPPANYSETTDFEEWTLLDSPLTPISYDKTRNVYQHFNLTTNFEDSIHFLSGDSEGAPHSLFRTSADNDYTGMEESKLYAVYNNYFNPPHSHLSLDISPFKSVGLIDVEGNVSEDEFESAWRQGSIHIEGGESAAPHSTDLYHSLGHTIGTEKQQMVYQGHFLSSPFENIPLSSNPFELVDLYDEAGELTGVKESQWKLGSIHIEGGETHTPFDEVAYRDKTYNYYQNHYLTQDFTSKDLPGEFGPTFDLRDRDTWKGGSIHIGSEDTQEPTEGGVTKFASLLRISDYPQLLDDVSKLFIEKKQQTLFNIPMAYPDNTLAFTLEGDGAQFGYGNDSKYIENVGDVPPDIIPNLFPSFTEGGGRGLFTKFYQMHFDDPNWPYKILPISPEMKQPWVWGEGNLWGKDLSGARIEWSITESLPDTYQPYVRRTIGDRYGTPPGEEMALGKITSWLTLVTSRFGDDSKRIGNWLKSPIGKVWRGNQVMLQGLNPRPETRIWGEHSILGSLAPMAHVQRHMTIPFIGDGPDYENYEPFEDEKMMRTYGFGYRYGTKSDQTDDSQKGGAYEGRLWRLTEEFIIPEILAPPGSLGFLGDIATSIAGAIGDIFSGKSFGRTPPTPTHDVKSQGGPFGQKGIAKSLLPDANEPGEIIKRYATISYGELGNHKYGDVSDPDSLYTHREIADPKELRIFSVDDGKGGNLEYGKRKAGSKIVQGIGQQGRSYIKTVGGDTTDPKLFNDEIWDPKAEAEEPGAGLGLIKTGVLGNYRNELVDKVNIHPYGEDLPEDTSDFIKFKFFDVVNKKFLIFRALLSGISDSITPDWTDLKYIGRPDKVYVYQGADRKVSFTFDIYPKTKQEFPVLLEKLNYLVGLCYPSFEQNRMVAPFIKLTIGDMFKGTPGFLGSLSITVEDNTTWELDEGLQFPKYIKCACDFTYIGKYMPSSLGKHYELPWLTDFGWTAGKGEAGKGAAFGTFKASDDPARERVNGKFPLGNNPVRNKGTHHYKLFDNLGATTTN